MSKVYVIQMCNGQLIMGQRNEHAEAELRDTMEGNEDFVILSYPASLDIFQGKDENGNVTAPQMSINPYFPFGSYSQKDGLTFYRKDYVHAMPAANGLSEAHRGYENKIRAQEGGLVIAGANDLPENRFGVDADEMTGGGLRITED